MMIHDVGREQPYWITISSSHRHIIGGACSHIRNFLQTYAHSSWTMRGRWRAGTPTLSHPCRTVPDDCCDGTGIPHETHRSRTYRSLLRILSSVNWRRPKMSSRCMSTPASFRTTPGFNSINARSTADQRVHVFAVAAAVFDCPVP
jgi:hypothetical protein